MIHSEGVEVHVHYFVILCRLETNFGVHKGLQKSV